MRPVFDLDALRTIVAGADLGSFARAAAQLGRSQSAVSMQLKKLEEQAGQALFRRNGRGLVPTEAGDKLLAYARRFLSLHDEAAIQLGTAAAPASVRLGLPQDFFEDVMPDAITRYARQRPGVHVEVRAGRNHGLEEEVRHGRIDVALAFFPAGARVNGTKIATLPLFWYSAKTTAGTESGIPLVLFDHPCLFRQTALQALDHKGLRWRLALTTPSLPGIWAAVRAGYGVTARTSYRIPSGIRDVGAELRLPKLPGIELWMLTAGELPPAAADLRDTLDDVVRNCVAQRGSSRRH